MSLTIDGHGCVVVHGSAVTMMITSDSKVFCSLGFEAADDQPPGDWPSRTNSPPQPAIAADIATAPRPAANFEVSQSQSRLPYSLMIFGVMKMSSSRLSSVNSSRLNSQPSSGSRCRAGVRSWLPARG